MLMHNGTRRIGGSLAFLSALALGGTACSGSSGGSANSSGSDGDAGNPPSDASGPTVETGPPSTGGVVLSVDSAAAPYVIDNLSPPTGTSYLVLTVTLKNTGAPRALSTDPLLFSLETSGDLIIQMAGLVDGTGCSATVSVASGGQTQCEVGFEIPTGQTASSLLYDDHRGDKASAAIPVIEAPPACETVFGWFSSPEGDGSCLSCVESQLLGGEGGCASAAAAYRSMCTSCANCEQEQGDASSVCSCEASCDTAQCQTLFSTYMACIESACASDCATP
jgi:hypothetical protein